MEGIWSEVVLVNEHAYVMDHCAIASILSTHQTELSSVGWQMMPQIPFYTCIPHSRLFHFLYPEQVIHIKFGTKFATLSWKRRRSFHIYVYITERRDELS